MTICGLSPHQESCDSSKVKQATTMPPKVTPEKVAKMKSRLVSCRMPSHQHDHILMETVDQLPTDLKLLWCGRKYEEFLQNALKKLANYESKKDDESWEKPSDSLLAILPVLGYSFDQDVHELVQEFYYTYTWNNLDDLTDSRYHMYVMNVMSIERSKLIPEEWLEEVFPDHNQLIKEMKKYVAEELTSYKATLITFPINADASYLSVKNTCTLQVESSFASKCRAPAHKLQQGFILSDIAEEFVQNMACAFKLDSKFPELPGVYLLYFIATRELYPGSQFSSSKFCPVYVGMSTTAISKRLVPHRKKIEEAKDLKVTDFAVKVMLVDNKHYAPCIEGMLIERFHPVWNKESIGLCFGGGEKSTWRKFHVDQDTDTRNLVLGLLRIKDTCSSTESELSEEQQGVDSDTDVADDLASLKLQEQVED